MFKKAFSYLLILLFFYSSVMMTPNTASAASTDVTSLVENLGQPFSKPVYARNVWDMQVFNSKIYLGHGNSSNSGPSPNAGVDGIISYDIAAKKFINEYKISEAQIDSYKVLDGNLYIPGRDPAESWDLGNYYKLQNNSWQKFRNIPKGIHNFGMESLGGKLFSALGTTDKNTVLCSNDTGLTWSSLDPTTVSKFTPNGGYIYSLFRYKNKVYAGNLFFNGNNSAFNKLVCIEQVTKDGKSTLGSSVMTVANMVPGAPKTAAYKLVRVTAFSDKLLYIAGLAYNGHQTMPYALYCSTDINKAAKVTLPESNALPTDILERGNTAYVLAYAKQSDTKYTNLVYSTTDGKTYTEVFRFTQDTFARSFEEANGDFYFGLGCDTDVLPKSTGSILRVASKHYRR